MLPFLRSEALIPAFSETLIPVFQSLDSCFKEEEKRRKEKSRNQAA
jgi:hypothetical protein